MREFAWMAVGAGLLAGGRWARARLMWGDHQAVKAKERELRGLRWREWRRAAVGVGLVVVVLWVAAKVDR